MTPVLEAYKTLRSIAESGHRYCLDDVYTTENETEEERIRIIGIGYDLSASVLVPDRSAEGLVDGAVEFRVAWLINKNQPRILLRARLTWITSAGDKHISFVAYEFTFESDAAPPETKYSAVEAALEGAIVYDAFWYQIYPDTGSTVGSEASPPNPDTARYHAEVVAAARSAAPELLCMLSDANVKSVSPAEPELVLSWIQRQPEVGAISG